MAKGKCPGHSKKTHYILRRLHCLNLLAKKQQITKSIEDVEFAGIETGFLVKTLESAINLPKMLRHFARRVELK